MPHGEGFDPRLLGSHTLSVLEVDSQLCRRDCNSPGSDASYRYIMLHGPADRTSVLSVADSLISVLTQKTNAIQNGKKHTFTVPALWQHQLIYCRFIHLCFKQRRFILLLFRTLFHFRIACVFVDGAADWNECRRSVSELTRECATVRTCWWMRNRDDLVSSGNSWCFCWV